MADIARTILPDFAGRYEPPDSRMHFACDPKRPTAHERRFEFRWKILPYGFWVTPERAFLFNRSYSPIWSRSRDGKNLRAETWHWVTGIERQRWFYPDSNPAPLPKLNADILLLDILFAFQAGVPEDQLAQWSDGD